MVIMIDGAKKEGFAAKICNVREADEAYITVRINNAMTNFF